MRCGSASHQSNDNYYYYNYVCVVKEVTCYVILGARSINLFFNKTLINRVTQIGIYKFIGIRLSDVAMVTSRSHIGFESDDLLPRIVEYIELGVAQNECGVQGRIISREIYKNESLTRKKIKV